MKILGIDPGTATTGYGVIDVTPKRLVLLDYGLISTSKDTPHGERLRAIYDGIYKLLEKHQPQEVAIELLNWLYMMGESQFLITPPCRSNSSLVVPAKQTRKKLRPLLRRCLKSGRKKVKRLISIIPPMP